MTYDRYDDRRGYRDTHGRSMSGYDRDDRGFFDRARDEVASWFGDERAERRRNMDERYDDRDDRYDGDRYRRSSMSSDRDYDRYERSPRWRDEGYRRPYTGSFSGRSNWRGDFGSDRDNNRDRDWNRNREFGSDRDWNRNREYGGGNDRDFGSSYSYDRGYTNDRWDRGQTQRDFTPSASSMHDRDYSNWRNRQIDQFDRDYDEFRQENSSRFENEFSDFRSNRQQKRQMLGDVKEHMEVVGSDDEPVGKVDKIRGDRIILTKDDSPDGRHHALKCSMIDRVESDKVVLDCKAQEALDKLTNENRNRALFENDRDRDEGPHMLNRSFSGTY